MGFAAFSPFEFDRSPGLCDTLLTMSSICLCMIVKNEAHVIERCIEAARPIIDCWCIVDTGSTDGTQAKIQSVLAELPGRLYERRWRDFGENRSESLALAKGTADYLLLLDADDVLYIPEGFKLPALTAEAYSVMLDVGGTTFRRELLVSDKLNWRFVGVLHEYLTADRPYQSEALDGLVVESLGDGGRSQGIAVTEKYARDAAVLEEALKTEPDNSRYAFYLAQSYRDSEQAEKALAAYRRCVAMNGWAEEVWYSLLQIAMLSEQLNKSASEVREAYLMAFQFRPTRNEPLVNLARYCRLREEFSLARIFAEHALSISKPSDLLFLDESCYSWRAKDEYSVSCYWVGCFEESKRICEELLDERALPESERARIRKNLEFAAGKLASADGSS